jgi:hypothetical protein
MIPHYRACSTYEGENRYLQGVLRKGDHLEDPSVDGRIILKCILREVEW